MRVDRREAARRLTSEGFPISAATLAKLAVTGGGCPYRIWNGRATYDVGELRSWAESKLGAPVRSTAERTK